tara:strand:- start:5347 stop:5718 length:372 start_codon:yes stop_codon:yes gene_type:complete
MAIVNKVDFKIKVDMNKCIQYQLVTYCFFNGIQISNSDLKFLCELAKNNGIELTKFCNDIVALGIFKSAQSARNAINKAEKKTLLVKNGKNKKTIEVNTTLALQMKGLVLLDYKILGNESQVS